MWANADAMRERAGGKPVRVASKSIRCRALLEEILRRDQGFAGLMTFTLPETLWLAEQGVENLLLAYPTPDVGGLGELAQRPSGSASTSTPVGGRSAGGSRSGQSARRSTPSPKRSSWRARSSAGRR